jgi:HSP20 family protein
MLVKHKPFRTFPSLMDNIFNDWQVKDLSDTNKTIPAVNIKENDDEFIVTLAAPGMQKKDFNINLENDVLTISSEKTVEKTENEDNFTRREYNYQSFIRSFNVPKDMVDGDKIAAKYKNGELIIKVPKREEVKAKPPRLIEVH